MAQSDLFTNKRVAMRYNADTWTSSFSVETRYFTDCLAGELARLPGVLLVLAEDKGPTIRIELIFVNQQAADTPEHCEQFYQLMHDHADW